MQSSQNSGSGGKRIKVAKTDRDTHTSLSTTTKRNDTVRTATIHPTFPLAATQNLQSNSRPPDIHSTQDIYASVNSQLTALTQSNYEVKEKGESSSDELPISSDRRSTNKEEEDMVSMDDTSRDGSTFIEMDVVPGSILQHRKATRQQYEEGEDFDPTKRQHQQNEEMDNMTSAKENHSDEDVSDATTTTTTTSNTKKTWKTVYGSGPSASIMKGVINKFCCTCNKACTIRWWSYLIGLLFFFLFGAAGAGLVRFTIYLCTGTTVYSIGKLTVTSKIPCSGDFLMTVIIGSSGTLVFLITKYIFKEWMDKLTLYVIAVHTEKMSPTTLSPSPLESGHQQQQQTFYNRGGMYTTNSDSDSDSNESDSFSLTTTDEEVFNTLS